MSLTADLNQLSPNILRSGRISDRFHRFSNSIRLGLTKSQRQRSAAAFGQSLYKLVRNSRQTASLKRVFETLQHPLGTGFVRGGVQQRGCTQEIFATSGQCVTFH